MEVQHFDKNGNKIEESVENNPVVNNKKQDNKSQDNNPKIIKRSRLDDLPVVRIKLNEKKEDEIKTETSATDVSIVTKITKPKSKYEVDKETTFTVEFGIMFNDEQIIIIPKEKFEQIDNIDTGLYEKHWAKFRLWNFLESMSWRQECMEFIQLHRIFNLNTNKFNELKVRRLLLDWSFRERGDDHKLFHYNEQLTDESMNLFFKKFNPNIIQYIVNKMNDFLGE